MSSNASSSGSSPIIKKVKSSRTTTANEELWYRVDKRIQDSSAQLEKRLIEASSSHLDKRLKEFWCHLENRLPSLINADTPSEVRAADKSDNTSDGGSRDLEKDEPSVKQEVFPNF